MIKANELRIGNVVTGGVIISIGHKIGVKGNTTKEIFHLSESTLQPILITPEIIEKCGFVKDENNSLEPVGSMYNKVIKIGSNENKLHAICKLEDNSACVSYVVNDYWGSDNVIYLHQLQNLYFALTGEELQVNIDLITTYIPLVNGEVHSYSHQASDEDLKRFNCK